jgi:hypothetical protein
MFAPSAVRFLNPIRCIENFSRNNLDEGFLGRRVFGAMLIASQH